MPLSAFDEQNLFAAYLAFQNVPNGSVFELKRIGFTREVGVENDLRLVGTPATASPAAAPSATGGLQERLVQPRLLERTHQFLRLLMALQPPPQV